MTNENGLLLNPYLTFNGNCAEAMRFYKDALNAKLEMQTFGESPTEVPPEAKEKIMHASLYFESGVLMASDSMPDRPAKPGNNVNLSIGLNDEAEADRLFATLSKGGTVTMPYEKTFWGAKFGMFTDQFGIHWMINCELKQD